MDVSVELACMLMIKNVCLDVQYLRMERVELWFGTRSSSVAACSSVSRSPMHVDACR